MNIEETIKDCEIYLKQIKQYDQRGNSFKI